MFETLPEFILYRILRISTLKVQDNVADWSQGVPFLSICQHWRAVAKKLLYQYAVVTDPDTKGLPNHNAEQGVTEKACCGGLYHSNIGLIIQNSDCCYVKQLFIHTDKPRQFISPLLAVIRLLGLRDKEYPEIALLKAASRAMQQRQKLEPNEKYNLYIAAANIGAVFVRKFSKVNKLTIYSENANRTLLSFYSILTEHYIRQLVDLNCKLPAYFPVPWDATNLIMLQIHLSGRRSYRSPLINPENICLLFVIIDKIQFQWDWFHWDKSSDCIVFENLAALYINDNPSSSSEDMLSRQPDNRASLQLVAPKLRHLFDHVGALSSNSIEQLLQNGLTRLFYGGYSKDILEICKLNMSKVDKFDIGFDLKTFQENIDTFIENTNACFQRPSNAKNMRCIISSAKLDFDHRLLNWQFIKAMIIHLEDHFRNILRLLPCWPNLESLTITLFSYDESALKDMGKTLANLRQEYSEPSSSKIKKISLCHRELPIESYFADKIPIIKWFLPKVTTVHIGDML